MPERKKYLKLLSGSKKNNPLYKDISLTSSISQEAKTNVSSQHVLQDHSEENTQFRTVSLLKDQINDIINSSLNIYTSLNSSPQPDVSLRDFMKDFSESLSRYVLKKSSSPPVSIFRDTNVEEMSFPDLYPLGKNGLQEKRSFKISPLMYFQNRLFHKSGKWRKNIAWLFWAVNTYEIKKLYDEINIVCRMSKQGNSNKPNVTASDIRNCPSSLHLNSYAFMKNIRGTPGYWRDQLFDLLAKINTLGCPTFF